MIRHLSLLLSLVALLSARTAFPQALAQSPSYGPELEGFDYPFPVRQFAFTSQGQDLHMAYMDVAAAAPERGTAVLLHGKNFCGATWEATIKVLSAAGYRVIAPDQIGFCKSSKPFGYQFTFQQLARNTQALLASLGVGKATIIGHSTGGMLGIRYALMYPGEVRAAGSRRSDRARRLEDQGRSLDQRRPMVRARTQDHRRKPARL